MDPATHRRMRTAHANHTHTCVCGKTVRGNGGWASHRWACEKFQASRERFITETGHVPSDMFNVRRYPKWSWNATRERWVESGLESDAWSDENEACPRCGATAWTSWDDHATVTCDRCHFSEKVAPR